MKNSEIKPFEATEDQLAVWQKKHGDVYLLSVEDKTAYVRKPDRAMLSMAATLGKDPVKYSEVMLNNCWLDGDKEIKEVDEYFFAAAAQMASIIQIKEATLKKL